MGNWLGFCYAVPSGSVNGGKRRPHPSPLKPFGAESAVFIRGRRGRGDGGCACGHLTMHGQARLLPALSP